LGNYHKPHGVKALRIVLIRIGREYPGLGEQASKGISLSFGERGRNPRPKKTFVCPKELVYILQLKSAVYSL
jgi:hypothetical protein